MRTVDHGRSGAGAPACTPRSGPLLELPHPLPGVTSALVQSYRPRAGDLSRRIADRICREVAGFADPAVAVAVHRAIRSAVGLFVDALAGAPARGQTVAERFRTLGAAEARAGHDLDALRAAHHVATQVAWGELCGVAVEFAVPSQSLATLASALLDYQQELLAESVRGFTERRAQPVRDLGGATLVRALLAGTDPRGARTPLPTGWTPTTDVVVASCPDTPRARGFVAGVASAAADVRRDHLVVLLPGPGHDDTVRSLAALAGGPVAVSWAVSAVETPHAVRWTWRALRLAHDGLVDVPDDGVLRCIDLRCELSLHADPVLRMHLQADVLAPLAPEKPTQRVVLEETLLLWLQTRASAPALAEQLGVHSQTVRHRQRRLRAIFGPALDDPRRCAEILQALQAGRRLPA